MNPTPSICLSELPLGACARITELSGETQLCCRLREYGFCESARVERLSGVSTLLCQLGTARIALNRRVADLIRVEILPA